MCRELTKLYEEVFRGAAAEALAHFTEPRGEFTLVVAGAPHAVRAAADEQGAARAMARLKARGLDPSGSDGDGYRGVRRIPGATRTAYGWRRSRVECGHRRSCECPRD